MTAAVLSAIFTLCQGCRASGAKSAAGDVATDTMELSSDFDADTAFSYIARQVAMGPRVPGSEANARCAAMIESELVRHGASDVKVQRGEVMAFTGETLPVSNVMGSYNPGASRRILLVAHYDTRPWADSDPNGENRMQPVPGANDGASGVGVLLEIARQLGKKAPRAGVDLLFVDAEDYGKSDGFGNHDETWCLGTQYWTRNMPYAQDSLPRYAILLDMVGGMGAKFHREYFSNNYAPDIVDKVWSIARRSGQGERFVNTAGGAVVDDHVFLNHAGIPAIDIIESKNTETSSFNPTWHTVDDDIEAIDVSTLDAVGQVVLNVIYEEN